MSSFKAPAGRFQNIGWTVGNHCNARCGHCYSWQVRRSSDQVLQRTDIRRIIRQFVDLGVHTVNLGGNEPLYTHGPDPSRSELPFLLEELRRAGLPVGITTNGVTFRYLYENHLDALKTVNDIDFSLDYPYQRQHDAHRGVRLFRLALDAIRDCRALGIDCAITVCGTRDTMNEPVLADFLDLAARLDCELRFNLLKPVIPELMPQMPTRDQFFEGMAFLLRNTRCVTLAESVLSAVVGVGGTGCPCGFSSLRVNGRTGEGTVPVGPCIYTHDFRTGDLLTEDLSHIVQSEAFRRFTRRTLDLPRACREADCRYLEDCRGGCTARTWFVHRDLEARDPYCPLDYERDHGALPDFPVDMQVGLEEGLRVHDNYLCTWIGQVDRHRWPRGDRTVDHYLDGEGR